MYITSGISIRHDVYYNYLDARYSMNYRVLLNVYNLAKICNNIFAVNDSYMEDISY